MSEHHLVLTTREGDVTLTGPVPGRIATPLRSRLPQVPAGHTLELPGHASRWDFDAATFAQIDEAMTAQVAIHVFDVDRSRRMNGTMRLLARDEWWWMSIHESLTVFVTPRARAIQDLMSDASDLLGQSTGSPSIEGYQGGADRAWRSRARSTTRCATGRSDTSTRPRPSRAPGRRSVRSMRSSSIGGARV